MKINFIISSLQAGGAERVLTTFANNLVLRNHQVTIITFKNINDFKVNSEIKIINLEDKSFSNETIRYTFELYKFYKNKKNRPDITISFITQTSLSAILVCKILGIKIIACEHTNHLRTSTNKKLVIFTRKFVYRLADAITVLTKFDLDYYQKYKSNVSVLPNPSSFKYNENIRIQHKHNTLLAVGNLDKYAVKGFDNLISLIAPILKKNKDWKLKIIGAGELGKIILEKLIRKHELTNIELIGFKRNIEEIMAESKIFILSSRMEGLPMVLIEAMSQKMACIAYDCISGPSDIIKDNFNGFLIENQNHDEMAKHIQLLISDQELAEKFIENSKFTIEKYDENLVCDILEQLIIKATNS